MSDMSDMNDIPEPSNESIPDFIQLQQIPVNYMVLPDLHYRIKDFYTHILKYL